MALEREAKRFFSFEESSAWTLDPAVPESEEPAVCVCGSADLPPVGSSSPDSLLALSTNKVAIILNFNLGYETIRGEVSVNCPVDRVWNCLGDKPAGIPGRGCLAPGNSWRGYLHHVNEV